MANKKKEYFKPGPMTEGKRNIIQGLQEYHIESAANIQEALEWLLPVELLQDLQQDTQWVVVVEIYDHGYNAQDSFSLSVFYDKELRRKHIKNLILWQIKGIMRKVTTICIG